MDIIKEDVSVRLELEIALLPPASVYWLKVIALVFFDKYPAG